MKNKFDILVLIVLLLAAAGWVYTPHDPMEQAFLDDRLSGPGAENWLGVDGLGRDFASRVWRGAANTVGMAAAATVLCLLVALALLALEQGGPGWVRPGVRGLVAAWIGIPVLFVGLLLLVFLHPSVPTLVLAASLGSAPLAFRQCRALWLEQRHRLYVTASITLGASRGHLLRRTLWPNLRIDFRALAKLVFALCVLELSGLAFLGLIGDPDFPELGSLLRQNQTYLFRQASLVVWPGLVLFVILLLIQLSNIRNSGTRIG